MDQEEGMIDDGDHVLVSLTRMQPAAIEAMLRLCDVSLSLLLACFGFHQIAAAASGQRAIHGGGSDSDSWMGAATLVFVRLDVGASRSV